jgi:hypothetical protein
MTDQPSDQRPDRDIAFACDLSVFTPEARHHLEQLTAELFAAIQDIRELADGYAFRMPLSALMLAKLADFIYHDHRCCPFIAHGLELEPNSDRAWLRLSGGVGVKAFILAEFAPAWSEAARAAAGLNPSAP